MIEITLRDLISALADEGLALVEARPHAYGPANVMPAARLHSALTRRATDRRPSQVHCRSTPKGHHAGH